MDIIANLVGIFIILIVITGVRVSLNPVKESGGTDAAPVSESAPVQLPIEPVLTESTAVDSVQAEAEKLDLTELKRMLAAQPIELESVQLGASANWNSQLDSRLLTEVQQLEKTLQSARQQQASGLAEVNQLEHQATQTQQKLQVARLRKEQKGQTLSQLDQKQQQLIAEYASLMSQQASLSEQLVVVQRRASPAKTIHHAMVPMSKQVQGHEWHFEVREGKVAFIPLDELLYQLKQKVERWAEWIAKYDRHESTVGPIEGFTMEYKVSRQRGSLTEELTGGNGMFRIGVDRWELIPTGGGHAETLEQARQENSLFRSTLNRCSFDDTITLWVYPDSFDMYQELSRIAHEMGYHVAGRPLPKGRRIGGSPEGSKSLGQ